MKISSFPGDIPQTPLFAAAEKAAAVLRALELAREEDAP